MERIAVLIHGAFAGPWTMEPVAEALRPLGWDCRMPALRHHEGQPGDADALVGVSIADYCQDVAAYLETLPRKAVLIGHSMGGVIAQKLAGQDLAAAVVLLNSSVVVGVLPSSDAERELGRNLMSAGAFWQEAMHLDFDTMARFALSTIAPDQQRAIFERLGPESGRAIFELFFWMFDQQQTTAIDTARVRCPLLVVAGAEDRGVSPESARKIAGLYGEHADLLIAEGCCHYIMQDRRFPEVAEQIAAWMDATSNTQVR